MKSGETLRAVDQVEILTLADNYIDLVSTDSNEVVARAATVKDLEAEGSVLAEHGFSAVVKTIVEDEVHEIFFDFGLSDIAVPYNVKSLGVDLSGVEAAALSHGHGDHYGSLIPMVDSIPTKPLRCSPILPPSRPIAM